jgi:hypothetical protein
MDHLHGTIHCEIDVLLRIKRFKNKKVLNMLIFTTNKQSDKFVRSKSCNNCLNSIKLLAKKKNCIIKYIYYTNIYGYLCRE